MQSALNRADPIRGSRLLQQNLFSSKETKGSPAAGRLETHHRSQSPQHIPEDPTLPHGDHPLYLSGGQTRGLGGVPVLEGCIPSHPNPRGLPKSPILLEGWDFPVQSPPFRSRHSAESLLEQLSASGSTCSCTRTWTTGSSSHSAGNNWPLRHASFSSSRNPLGGFQTWTLPLPEVHLHRSSVRHHFRSLLPTLGQSGQHSSFHVSPITESPGHGLVNSAAD